MTCEILKPSSTNWISHNSILFFHKLSWGSVRLHRLRGLVLQDCPTPHISAEHASAWLTTNFGILTTPPFKFDISLKEKEPSKDTWNTFTDLLWRIHLESSQMEEMSRTRDGGGPPLNQHKNVFHTFCKPYCPRVFIELIFSSPFFLRGRWWGWSFPPLTFRSFWRPSPSWSYREMVLGGSANLLAKNSMNSSLLECSLLWINNRPSKSFRSFVAETRNKEQIYFSNFHRRNKTFNRIIDVQ